jgi:hypothetical protein
MFNIYEIRNKATHRIEFISLFKSTERPDDTFRADPVSQSFANRYDIYINIDAQTFKEEKEAIAYLHQKRIDYKLPALDLFAKPAAKVARPRKPKAE